MEFLLENPFILIVIFAIISSLFKKGKGSSQNQKNTSSRAKPIEARTIQKQQAQSRTMDNRKTMSPLKRFEQMATEMAERLEKEYAEKRKLAESTVRQAKEYTPPTEKEVKSIHVEVEKPVIKPTVIEEKQAHVPHSSFSVEKQKVIDGVVWAEILGPPRALNPHRTLRRK